ncbi:hypothetical protein MOSE0_G08768 [Monosporozyma servazzii]
MSSKSNVVNSTRVPTPSLRSLIFNLASLIICSRGLYKCSQIILPAGLKDAGHKQFLTNISVVATLISNVFNISNWAVQRFNCSKQSEDKSCCNASSLHYVSRHLILPIALILETIVPLVYWPLRLFAQNLIMQDIPKDAPNPLSISTDISIHLFPFIFLFSDHYLSGSGSKFDISNTRAWCLVATLGIAYFQYLAILIDPTKGQIYPYPFLNVEEPFKSVIFVVVSTAAWFFYVIYQKFPPHTHEKKSKTN